MEKRALILGAAGRFGMAAVRAFANAGWQVVAQIRPSRAVERMPVIDGVTWLPRALDTAAATRGHLLTAATGCQVVVHGLNPEAYTNRIWTEQVPSLMTAAIDVAAALNATLMFPGNVYNFGEHMPPLLREETPQQATHTKGRLRIAAERQLAEAVSRRGLRAVIIRAGDYFGSGRGSMFDQAIAKELPRGRLTLTAGPGIATPWAYLPDLAQTFVAVAERRASLRPFEVIHFAGHVLSDADWMNVLTDAARSRGWIGQQASLKRKDFPWWLIGLAAPLVPLFRSLLDMRYLAQRPHALDNSHLMELLGAEPHTPLSQAVSAALDELYPQQAM